MVVAPRYNPAPVVQSVDFRPDGGGWGSAKSDPVPDRDRISPEVLDPATNAPVNPTRITVRLQAGFPLGEIKSHHHAIKTEKPDASTSIIRLAEGPVPADRDFELTWKPAAEKAPSVGLFRERVGDSDYLLAFVTPPSVEQAQQKPLPREVIFVIDNSGSMGGVSIIQAKASLIYALGRLQPNDRFNVIRFDHTMDVLFPAAVPADREHIGQATSFVDALQANGGTEMVPAMRAALSDNAGDASYVRQVVFLTDGAIGNEQQLFETINALRGRSRIFMVGIGSAPNTYLMTRAAELGRGTFTHIGSVEQVEERMRGLFAKLENPAVTNLTAKFSDAAADITPVAIPDVYRDEPLVLAAKLDKLAGSVEIKGRIGDRPWVVTLPLANAAEGKGLSKLWARRKIADAEVARTTRQASPEDADKTILALALEHQLVTRLTSLVAVDKTPSRPEGAPLKVAELPINLPAGWDFEKVFGERPRDSCDADGTARGYRGGAGSGRGAETGAACRHPGAQHGHAAEDGDGRRTEDDCRCDPAHAQPDPVGVQSTSDVTALTSAEKRRLPTSSFQSARGFHLSPRAARAAFSHKRSSLRAKREQSILSPRGKMDCFASLAMTGEQNDAPLRPPSPSRPRSA